MAQTTAVIVQARHASTRLPGKVMLDLAGHTVLSHVLHRCLAIPGADHVCCAVPEGVACDQIATEAERCGATVFRGSEHDVLDRTLQAARDLSADVVLRVTSDCPLIDPTICDQVLELRASRAVDYASNNLPPTWPHGLDCEAFTVAALARAAAETEDDHEREHVTPRLRTAPGYSRANLEGPGGRFPGLRWTLDYPEDHAYLQALFGYLPPWPTIPDIQEMLRIIDQHPEIAALNAGRIEAARRKAVKV